MHSPDYKQAFEVHTCLAGLFLKYPAEGLLKPVMEAIMLKPEEDEVRYKLAMYFFVLLWRSPLEAIKKLMTKVEDAAIYLGPDDCLEVRDALSMSMIVLKMRDESYYRRCIKLMRKSVVDAVEQNEKEYGEALREKLGQVDFSELNHFTLRKDDGRPMGKGADYKIVQMCPMSLRDISSYLDCVDPDNAQEELRMSAKFASYQSDQDYDEADEQDEPERDDYYQNNKSQNKNESALQAKFSRYKSQDKRIPTITERTEDSRSSRAPTFGKTSVKSSRRSPVKSVSKKDRSKAKPSEASYTIATSHDIKERSPGVQSFKEPQHKGERSKVPPCLVSPQDTSKIRIETNPPQKVTRFSEPEEEHQYKHDLEYSGLLRKGCRSSRMNT